MTRHASDRMLPAAPPGAREWLAEVLRWAIADALRGSPIAPPANRAGYVVGHLLGQAALAQHEQMALMDFVAPAGSHEAAPQERAGVSDPKRQ